MVHPILAAVASVRASLTTVGDANPTFMATEDKADALRELVRAESQLCELRLRIMAGADDVAPLSAAHDAAGWLSHETRVRVEDARADLVLAAALDRRFLALCAALREGRVTVGQARVIVRSVEALPESIDAEVVTRAEQALVAKAGAFGPRDLARLGRGILEVVAPEIAARAQARQLADLESDGARLTRLTMRRLGDGTTRLSGRVPDLCATRLATYLEAYANPRKHRTGELENPERSSSSDALVRLPYPRRLGEALGEFLESVDTRRLPVHGGDATTLIVTMPLAALMADLGVADLLTRPSVPPGTVGGGCADGGEAVGEQLSAAHARRLACTARIIPAVLGADSQPLDLGRSQRLFSPAQRKALLLLRDTICRAEGCDHPGAWCDAHHLTPWSALGVTDLTNAVLLCSHHHHRIHDPVHGTDRLPNGDIRFHRRR